MDTGTDNMTEILHIQNDVRDRADNKTEILHVQGNACNEADDITEILYVQDDIREAPEEKTKSMPQYTNISAGALMHGQIYIVWVSPSIS